MLDRLKLAGHSMLNKMDQMNVVTNNLANINTRGFKRDQLFVNELQDKIEALQFPNRHSSIHIPGGETVIDFTQGALGGTGNPLDIAISGDGLFTVETLQGEAFTRDGRLSINNEGILVNIDALPVLGEGGPIEIDLQQSTPQNLIINETGEVLLDGSVLDKLKIVSISDPQNYLKIGSNLFRAANPDVTPEPLETPVVKQGFLEDSNVNAIDELVTMMEIFHYYQTNEKMIKSQDSLLNRAANDIGRVNM